MYKWKSFSSVGDEKERREAMTEVLRLALERCGEYSKTCFAVIYTERKGIVAYASPKNAFARSFRRI